MDSMRYGAETAERSPSGPLCTKLNENVFAARGLCGFVEAGWFNLTGQRFGIRVMTSSAS